MSKATLTFDLPEEESDFKSAVDGHKWEQVVWDLNELYRKWDKYGHEFNSVTEALAHVRKAIYETMEEHEVQFQ